MLLKKNIAIALQQRLNTHSNNTNLLIDLKWQEIIFDTLKTKINNNNKFENHLSTNIYYILLKDYSIKLLVTSSLDICLILIRYSR